MRPGITGWAQVRRGYTSDVEVHAQKLSYDLWYLRHRSLVVDFAILLQTFAVLVKGSVPKTIFVANQEPSAEHRSGSPASAALDVVRPRQVRDPEPAAGQSPRA